MKNGEWEKETLCSDVLARPPRSSCFINAYSASRTCIINSGITLWNAHPLKCRGKPAMPAPFSPVQSARKFSAVFGTMSDRSVISMRPTGASPMTTSKKTMGFFMLPS